MLSKTIAAVSGFVLCVCIVAVPVTADDAKPKYKIKDVMKKAMKGPLLKKVASGDASEEETKELYDMLVALSKNKPPKGEAEGWEKKTGALVKAGKAAVDGDPEAGEMLKKAANCKKCHGAHK